MVTAFRQYTVIMQVKSSNQASLSLSNEIFGALLIAVVNKQDRAMFFHFLLKDEVKDPPLTS